MAQLVPPELLDGVIRELDPVEVYLFGSRARGEAGPDSDIDLFVVVDDQGASEKWRGSGVAEARAAYRGAVDILLAARSRFETRRKVLGTFEEIIDHEGVRVYARG